MKNFGMKSLCIATMIIIPLLLIVINFSILNNILAVYMIAVAYSNLMFIFVNRDFNSNDEKDKIPKDVKFNLFLICFFITVLSQIGIFINVLNIFSSGITAVLDYLLSMIYFIIDALMFAKAAKDLKDRG